MSNNPTLPERRKPTLPDVERVREMQKTSLIVLAVQHGGLAEISKLEPSAENAATMRAIAQATLAECERIAKSL